MPATPLTEILSIRLTQREKRLLEWIAGRESDARQVEISLAWVIRLLINKHALSHLTEENRRRFVREQGKAESAPDCP